ncbi:MAG: enterobactin transporter EntS [Moraxellaceae bacterium]|nr:MAG: enterobactin transporter EntS [Moraxellaceae bacterium]
MSKPSIFVNFGILKTNRHFRNTFIARTISLLGLGMLAVAIPKQVYDLTSDTFQVGLVMALEGLGLFIGLLLGGVLADRYNRKTLILFARSICGLGFVGLAINAMLSKPLLWVIYLLSIWDGFFGALGVTALLACMPFIVGRENLMQARAVSMVTVRLATVISPAIGGLVIASSGVVWTYLIAALGTLLTLLPLLSLPAMQPKVVEIQHPLKELADGIRFLLSHKVVASVVAIGTLVTLTTAIRVLFPEMVEKGYGGGAFELGLMYAAVPLGATLGALVSGWAAHVQRPGLVMINICLGAFACMMLLGVNPYFYLSLLLLVMFGYLVSIASLLQYSMVQGHTPDHFMGRVNALWTAQDASGDSIGTLGIGILGKFMSSLASIFSFGTVAFVLGLGMLWGFKTMREAPMNDPQLQEDEPETLQQTVPTPS